MREIKFRAWNRLMKCMCKTFTFDSMRKDAEKILDSRDVINQLLDFSDCDLMQYTGLEDKNGKEIYEGDIFNCIYKGDGCNHRLLVIWDEGSARFWMKSYGKCDQLGVTQTIWDMSRHEVIGNVYENPELLRAENRGNTHQ